MKVFVAVCLLWTSLVFSHPLDMGYLQIDPKGKEVDVTFDLNATFAAQLSPTANAGELLSKTLGRSALVADAVPCTWGEPTLTKRDLSMRLAVSARCEAMAREYQLDLSFLSEATTPSTFQVLAKARLGEGEQLQTAQPGKTSVKFDAEGTRSFFEFVWMGVEHIGAAPSEWHNEAGWHLPDGVDHILFLLALILVGGNLLQMIGTATGFTVGHSITLALASLGVLNISGRIIEPIIALSIAFVAAEALFVKKPRHRWQVAMFFGLVHGFGFANALTELGLTGATLAKALVGYNVGVELGQLVILMVLAPLVLWLRQQNFGQRFVLPTTAGSIAVAGFYWFVQRAFALG